MPAVFGLVLFFTLPCMKQMDRLGDRTLSRFCWLVLLVCMVIAMSRGWKRHSSDGFNTMAAHQQLIDNMLKDSQARKVEQIRYGVMHLTDLNSNSLYFTLLFDRVGAKPGLNAVEVEGVEIERVATFSRPAATDWRILSGDSDAEKIDFLVADANARIDYLILPNQATATELQTTAAHNYVNRYLIPLRQRIVDDESWVRIGEPVPTDENEIVEIYRKRR
jgi:hypothetical protein